ncbi:hypothetical protein R2F25_04400 [Streptomyces sp. UP1A-1]|nr:hypothetical protein [Streptomyces sp. UP1A-1]
MVRAGRRRQEGPGRRRARTVHPERPEARRDRRRQERDDRLPLHEGRGLAEARVGLHRRLPGEVAGGGTRGAERHRGRRQEGPDDLHPARRRRAADGRLLADLHLRR